MFIGIGIGWRTHMVGVYVLGGDQRVKNGLEGRRNGCTRRLDDTEIF